MTCGSAMKPWKTIVPTDDDGYVAVDTIDYDVGVWLVPVWLEGPSPTMKKPARLIRLDTLPHHDLEGRGGDSEGKWYILDVAIPKAVLEGRISTEALRIDVIEAPDLLLRIDGDE